MADDLEEDFDDVDGDDSFDEEGKKGGGRRKMLIIILLALLVVVGGGAGAYFTGMLDPVLGASSGGDEAHGADAGGGADDGHGGHGGGGGGHGGHGAEGGEGEAGALGHTVFYDLPEMIVDLNATGGRKAHFLKVRVSLELANQADVARVEAVMPRVIDNFQTFLRELRVEDLQGAAGIYRVREELLRRVANAVRPAQVNAVLFKEMLVQ
ncbi:flagellar basal body-associated FliL family protein [Roseospira visakhapatnamensis]|uniref:Flagellar protein FliL n=1 Tax=Roseospira visakhapatnamensis TaxID=390880 RepID=A0A7W6RDZ9_9PROT|nr:flagellar basal body-associated FliL family protein [Roseospira visakhapatnamensis]MBB4266723.1 flagellar FliL protein [Roseospira visakhapatnamensis]